MIDKRKKVLIFTGGTIETKFAKEYLSNHNFDTIIGVDSGLNMVDALNLSPDYIVGDFDSVSKDILDKYLNGKAARNGKGPIIKTYPSNKDYTDTHLGIKLAMSIGATDITILGATGSRMDHFMSNVSLLIQPLQHNVRAFIVDSNNKIYLIDSNTSIKKDEAFGTYYSLLPFTQEVFGVTLIGFKYPLYEKDIMLGESIGISNEIHDEEAFIEIKKGILIAIESKD